MPLYLTDILTFKVRIFIYTLSLSSLLFLETYSTNICPFIDGLRPSQVYRNLSFILVLLIIYRETLYHLFKKPWRNFYLPRQAYFLSIISWLLAGLSAFILHFTLYPNFPISSHIKLFASFSILGAGILAQIEYVIFEMSYKEIAVDIKYNVFKEKISQRILETFLIFTIAPVATLLLIISRYTYEGVLDPHIAKEIIYMGIAMILASMILAFTFKKSLKNDTKIIVDDIQKVKEEEYCKIQTINRPDELGEISYAIKDMAHYIDNNAQKIAELNEEIITTQREIIYTMGEIAETRSKETGNHVKRVAQYSKILALKLGLDEEEAELLKQASPMHDIGKVGIPDNILNKPGKLTPDEFEIMKTHAQLGFEMLKHSNKKILQAAAIVAGGHHEKYDGSGYPNGLQGEDIHIYARITAVADVFDALGSDRVYKKAWKDEDIFSLFREQSGKHFDPKIITLFFESLDEVFKVRKMFQDTQAN